MYVPIDRFVASVLFESYIFSSKIEFKRITIKCLTSEENNEMVIDLRHIKSCNVVFRKNSVIFFCVFS